MDEGIQAAAVILKKCHLAQWRLDHWSHGLGPQMVYDLRQLAAAVARLAGGFKRDIIENYKREVDEAAPSKGVSWGVNSPEMTLQFFHEQLALVAHENGYTPEQIARLQPSAMDEYRASRKWGRVHESKATKSDTP